MYTTLHADLEFRLISIELLSRQGGAFRLNASLDMVITHQTIAVLYPHMLQDMAFLQQALGQRLTIRALPIVLFDERNQITAVELELKSAEAWLRLLKDPELVARVLAKKMTERNWICIG